MNGAMKYMSFRRKPNVVHVFCSQNFREFSVLNSISMSWMCLLSMSVVLSIQLLTFLLLHNHTHNCKSRCSPSLFLHFSSLFCETIQFAFLWPRKPEVWFQAPANEKWTLVFNWFKVSVDDETATSNIADQGFVQYIPQLRSNDCVCCSGWLCRSKHVRSGLFIRSQPENKFIFPSWLFAWKSQLIRFTPWK